MPVKSPDADQAASTRLLEVLREREQALAAERKAAPARLAELAPQDHAHRLLLVRNSARFATWGVAEQLIDESYRHRFHDTKRSLEFAELGVEAADRLDPEVYGSGPVHDIRARSWAVKGNALRLTADLRGASRCLNLSMKLLELGSGDPLEEARVCELFAVVRSNQRRIDQAVRYQERAMRLYRHAGHQDRLGKAMVDLASYNALAGDRQQAIELVQEALDLIDVERDPHTALAARHNLAVFLQECGRRREALSMLAAARVLCEQLGDRSHVLRLRWLEGKLASEVGETELAQDAYEEVYEGFVEYAPIDAALVALDLALLHLESGRVAEVPAIVIAVESVFRTQGVDREALAAWIVLREAVDRERLHDALIKHTAAILERERNRR